MIDLGHFALVSAWLFSMYGLIVGVIAARRNSVAGIRSAAHSVYLTALFSLGALGALAHAFLTHEYRYLYVWQNSNNRMPPYYLVSAIWGGMDGSMLLWGAIMSVFAGLVVWYAREVKRDLLKWVIPVLSGGTGFFLFVVTFLTNPFRLVPEGAAIHDGNGLNPLLQNPLMMIHPPMLYLGFTGFVVPFAFCIAALISGELSDNWIRLTRRWTLIAWGFLSAGIVLGGAWAYVELGWGGYWAWDPVENSSFLPWLTGTAYLHSVMVQEQKGMLKVWNVVLAVITYTLTIFGTFLTRSGIVQSVHAFAETDVGWVFLVYIVLIVLTTAVFLLRRWSELKPERPLESYLSREAAFLFNNLALLAIAFSTFWGVMFPVLSEAFADEKSVVGPPFFNKVNVPLFIVLLFLMGAGPLIAWRRNSLKNLVRTFRVPLISASLITLLFLWLDPSRLSAAIAFGLCVFVLITIEAEFRRAVRIRRQLTSEGPLRGVVQVIRRRPRRYGGFLVHLGVAVMAIAITASSAYKIEKDITLKKGAGGEEVGRYLLSLLSLEEVPGDHYTAVTATVEVRDKDSGKVLEVMKPERRVYGGSSQEVTTEVALRTNPREDLYLALAGLEMKGSGDAHSGPLDQYPVLLKVFVNPLQQWLWFGGLVMLFGTVIVIVQSAGVPAVQEVPADSRAKAVA